MENCREKFTDALKKVRFYPVPIFFKITIPQKNFAGISYTEFHTNRIF